MSSNQPADICSKVDYDFAIVKATGNPHGYDWDYVNPYAKQQADEAYAKTGLVGLYHFTYGLKDPCQEADHFIAHVEKLGYLGKAMLVIDYEADALAMGRSWLASLCRRVHELAGYKPVIYTSGGIVVGQMVESLGYPFWAANYYRGYDLVYGYDTEGMRLYRGCENACMWQFTSSGRLDGYSENLDLDEFFGDSDDFIALTHA